MHNNVENACPCSFARVHSLSNLKSRLLLLCNLDSASSSNTLMIFDFENCSMRSTNGRSCKRLTFSSKKSRLFVNSATSALNKKFQN